MSLKKILNGKQVFLKSFSNASGFLIYFIFQVRIVKLCWPRVALSPARMEAYARSPKTMRASLVCVLKDGKVQNSQN